MGGQLVSYLLPSAPVNPSAIPRPAAKENRTSQNAENSMPTEGTNSSATTQKPENSSAKEKIEGAKDGATKQNTEKIAARSMTSSSQSGSKVGGVLKQTSIVEKLKSRITGLFSTRKKSLVVQHAAAGQESKESR